MLAALLEGGLAFGTSRGLFSPEVAGPLAKALVLGLVGYGLWANRELRSLWFVGLGLACNAAVMLANGGHMPVSLEALSRVGLEGAVAGLQAKADAVHSLMRPDTPLWWLGDVIPVKVWGYSNVMSLGDVFLMAGITLTVVDGALLAKERRARGEGV